MILKLFIYILIFVLLFNSNIAISQTINNNSNIIFSVEEESSSFFHRYDPPLKITAGYTNVTEAVNEYPEQLMQSVLSARNQEWVNYNTLGGEENARQKNQAHFNRIITMEKEENYFELHHKLIISVGNIPTAFIKFFFYQERKSPVSGCMVIQKINGRWYKTSHPSFSTIAIIIMRLKTDVLEGAILGNTEVNEINEFREKIFTDGALDLQKMENEFVSWYQPTIDQVIIEKYKDPNAW